jgi:alpha-glucosidase
MHYPSDSKTFDIQTQFFYGASLLVNPVTEEKLSSVSFYLPRGNWYDFTTQKPVSGAGTTITYNDVSDSDIPVLVSGGSIIPARIKSAMTTKALRENDFELLVAPDGNGKASGSLYLDDGESLTQSATSKIVFSWDGQKIKMEGTFGFKTSVGVKSVTVMGNEPQKYTVNATLTGPWEQKLGGFKTV